MAKSAPVRSASARLCTLLAAALGSLWGCATQGLAADDLTYTELPRAPEVQPSGEAMQTSGGQVLARTAAPSQLLRLVGTAWEPVSPDVGQWMRDWAQGRVVGLATGGDLVAQVGDGFAAFTPSIPQPPTGWSRMLGIDQQGVAWISQVTNPSAGVYGLRVDSWQAPATAWTMYAQSLTQPLVSGAQFFTTMTGSGRLFFPTHSTGLMEIKAKEGKVETLVPCTHTMLRPSHSDYTACQEDTFLLPARNGDLLILNPNNELWRIPADSAVPSLVVGSTLSNLPRQTEQGYNRYRPGAPSLYADPSGRVWLLFRWGENTDEDTSYLYVWDPAAGSTWTFLRGDLPRVLVLHGDGEYPMIGSLLAGDGLRLWRVGRKE